MPIVDHPIVKEIGGTMDYIGTDPSTGKNYIHDIKTSKRKTEPSAYSLQQTIYSMLCEHNGIKIDKCYIQGIVLKASPEGSIQEVFINRPQVQRIIDSMLDVLDLYSLDIVDPDTLFGGNPKYYLCTNKYCNSFNTCSFVNG